MIHFFIGNSKIGNWADFGQKVRQLRPATLLRKLDHHINFGTNLPFFIDSLCMISNREHTRAAKGNVLQQGKKLKQQKNSIYYDFVLFKIIIYRQLGNFLLFKTNTFLFHIDFYLYSEPSQLTTL